MKVMEQRVVSMCLKHVEKKVRMGLTEKLQKLKLLTKMGRKRKEENHVKKKTRTW